jgi:hypothetical protein
MRVFLERMTTMTKDRLDAIERLATRIAESSLWKDAVNRLFRARNVIGALLEISDQMLQRQETPLKCENIYIAFDIVSDEDSTARDSYFVRDLILLKILELRGEPALPEREAAEELESVN